MSKTCSGITAKGSGCKTSANFQYNDRWYCKRHKPPDQPQPKTKPHLNLQIKFSKPSLDNYQKNVKNRNEYDLWKYVESNLPELVANQYFTLPIKIEENTDGFTIFFKKHGYDLCKPIIYEHIKNSTNPIKTITYIFKQVARGISLLNSIGLIHRDIKPDNILVDPTTWLVKITDIGNACKVKDINQLDLIPSISIMENKVNNPTYPYYPPHKFYLEDWILENLNSFDLVNVCNLLTNYNNEHRLMVKDLYPTELSRLGLISIYQRDDPRVEIHKLYKDQDRLFDLRQLELRMWDVYSFGVSLIIIISKLELGDNILIYKLATEMCCPNAGLRPSLSNFLKKID